MKARLGSCFCNHCLRFSTLLFALSSHLIFWFLKTVVFHFLFFFLFLCYVMPHRFFFLQTEKNQLSPGIAPKCFWDNTFSNNGFGWMLQCISQSNYCIDLNRLYLIAMHGIHAFPSSPLRCGLGMLMRLFVQPPLLYGIHCEDFNKSVRIVSSSMRGIKSNFLSVCRRF